MAPFIRTGKLRDAVLLFQQVDGNQGGLPVVAVDDIRGPVQVAGRLDDGTGEVRKALTIIEVAVDLPALEVILVVYKPVGHAVPLQLEDAAVHLPPGQRDIEILKKRHLFPPFRADPLIEGQDDLDLMPGGGERLGQGTGHIGQTAGFDERGYLGGSE